MPIRILVFRALPVCLLSRLAIIASDRLCGPALIRNFRRSIRGALVLMFFTINNSSSASLEARLKQRPV